MLNDIAEIGLHWIDDLNKTTVIIAGIYTGLALGGYVSSGVARALFKTVPARFLVRSTMTVHPAARWRGPARPLGLAIAMVFGAVVLMVTTLAMSLTFVVLSPMAAYRFVSDIANWRRGGSPPPRKDPAVAQRIRAIK
jgi:hypothetical protein